VSVYAFEVVNGLFSFISLFSCFLLFYLVWKRRILTSATKMILIISIGDCYFAMIQIIAWFFNANAQVCSFFQTSLNLSLWSSVMWSAALAILSYRSLKSPQSFIARRFYKKCVLIIFPISLIVSLYPLFHSAFIRYESTSQGFCFVTPNDSYSDTSKFLLMLLFQGMPIIISIVVTMWCYIKEIIMLQDVMEQIGQNLNVNPKQLLWYPICQLLVYTPHTIMDIIDVYDQNNLSLIFFIFFVLEKMPGLMNTVVYLIMNKPFSKGTQEEEIDDYETWDDSPIKSGSQEKSYDPRMLIEQSNSRTP
jgi:hypothetical protein